MEVLYEKSLQKKFKDDKTIQKSYGDKAKLIKQRIKLLELVPNLKKLFDDGIGRVELLKNNRIGQFSIRVSGNYRIIFIPVVGVLEIKNDINSFILENITIVKIIEIIDYHGD